MLRSVFNLIYDIFSCEVSRDFIYLLINKWFHGGRSNSMVYFILICMGIMIIFLLLPYDFKSLSLVYIVKSKGLP